MKTKVFIIMTVAVALFAVVGIKRSEAAVYYNGYANPTSTWYGNYSWVGLTADPVAATNTNISSVNGNGIWVDVWVRSQDGSSENAGLQGAHPYPSPSVYDTELLGVAFNGITSTGGERRSGEMVSNGTDKSFFGNVTHIQIYNRSCSGQPDCDNLQWAGGASNAMWGCVADTEAECDALLPTTSPTVVFRYPEDGTTTPMFDNFFLTFENLTSSRLYAYVLRYDWDYTFDTPGNSPTLLYGTGQDLMNKGSLIAYQSFLGITPFSNVRGVEASVNLFDTLAYDDNGTPNPNTPNCNFVGYLVLVDQCPYLGTFTSNFDQYTYQGTTTYIYVTPTVPTTTTSTHPGTFQATTTPSIPGVPVGNPLIPTNPSGSASSTAFCTAPSNILDVGGGISFALCGAMQLALKPSDASLEAFKNNTQTFITTPPLNLFFNLSTVIQSSTGMAYNSNYDVLYFNQSTTFLGNTPIPVLSSSSMANLIGTAGKNKLFEMIRAGLWVLFALFVMVMIYARFHHTNSKGHGQK